MFRARGGGGGRGRAAAFDSALQFPRARNFREGVDGGDRNDSGEI